MEPVKAITESDTARIAEILESDANVMRSRDKICNALGLDHKDLEHAKAGDKFFTVVLEMCFAKEFGKPTAAELIKVFRENELHSAADKIHEVLSPK